ncbi:MAG: phage tail tape measure protein [Halopseudomonas sp.]|uniref:phage tail tape measure protein n=1 Tax=Halopseudomonas sp. TaxID=2901191 RepID=UPI0030035BD7
MAGDLKLRVVLDTIDKLSKPFKRMNDRSKGLADQLKQTRDQLKQLQSSQKDVQSFRTLKTASGQTADALKQQQDKVRDLARQLGSTETASKKLRDEFNKAKRRAGELKDKHGQQQTALQQLRNKMGEAGISTHNLGEDERRLKNQINEANTSISAQGDRLKRLTQQHRAHHTAVGKLRSSQQLAGNMSGVGVRGMALGAASFYGASRVLMPGLDYGAQMSELQSVARLAKDDPRFQMLKDQARGLGGSTAFSASEVGAGQTFLARAGFSPEAIRASMSDVLNLALANNTDLARTADITSNISSAFKIDAEVGGNITRVADVLSGTASRANVDLEMLGDTMKYLGGKSDLGFTLEQAATMAGLLGNIGIQGSQAGTTTRGLINRLTAPAKAGAEAMESLGLKVADAKGNMRDLPSILRDINNATRNMGNVDRQAVLTDIFGVEAGSGSAELVSQMADGGLDRLLEQLQNVQGESARMASTMADNASGDLKGLRSAWEEIGISITDTNDGPLRELIQNLTAVLRDVGQWIKENPKLVGHLAMAAAVIAGVVAVGGTLLVMLSSIIGPLALLRYGLTLFGVAAGASLAPVLLVIGAIGLLATAAFMLYKNWDGVVGGLKAIWQNLTDAAKAVWGEITSAFDGGILGVARLIADWSPLGLFYRVFAGVLNWFGVELPSTFTGFGKMLIDGLISGITSALGKVKSVISSAGSQMIGWFKDKLGIHSPSRVFAGLGDDTMAGLRVGLERSQRGPLAAVIDAGKAIARTGALALGVGGAGQAIALDNRPPISNTAQASIVVQGDTNHYQITVPPGTDLQQMEQMFNRLFDQRERNKAARVRSSLFDLE